MVAWAERIDGRVVPVVARRAADATGAWEPRRALTDAPGSVAGALAGVVDPAGHVTLVWLARSGSDRLSVRYARSTSGGSWTHGQIASRAAGDKPAVALSVARDGTVVARWNAPDGRPRVAARRADGRWTAPRALPASITQPAVVAAPGGRVVVTGVGRAGTSARVVVSRSHGGRPFTTPRSLDACPRAVGLRVAPAAVDGAGRVTVAWSCARGDRRTVVRSPVAGPRWRFAAPTVLASGRDAGAIRSVAVGRPGPAVAIWVGAAWGRRHLYAAVRPRPAGRWGAPVRVTSRRIPESAAVYAGIDRARRPMVGISAPERPMLATRGPAIRSRRDAGTGRPAQVARAEYRVPDSNRCFRRERAASSAI